MLEERINDPEPDESQASEAPSNTEDKASMSAQDSDPIPSDPPQNT